MREIDMQISPDTFAFVYLVATILFIYGLKGLSSPKTALTGNFSGWLEWQLRWW